MRSKWISIQIVNLLTIQDPFNKMINHVMSGYPFIKCVVSGSSLYDLFIKRLCSSRANFVNLTFQLGMNVT